MFVFEVRSSDLKDYDSNTVNASVIVYGKSNDGETYILLAHDTKTGFWTPSGGRREKKHQSILDTAAEELFEETAAYPAFNPALTKSFFQQQPFKSVYNHIATKESIDIFTLNIGDEISRYENIDFNYQQRIEKRARCFQEMDQWKIFKAKDILFKLGSYNINFSTTDITFEIIDEMNVKHNINVQRYVFNSLLAFYQKEDLSQLMSHAPFQTNHIHNPVILPPVQQGALHIPQAQYQPVYNPMPQHYVQPAAPVGQHARAQYHPVHNPMPQAQYRHELYGIVQPQFQN